MVSPYRSEWGNCPSRASFSGQHIRTGSSIPDFQQQRRLFAGRDVGGNGDRGSSLYGVIPRSLSLGLYHDFHLSGGGGDTPCAAFAVYRIWSDWAYYPVSGSSGAAVDAGLYQCGYNAPPAPIPLCQRTGTL